MCIFIFEYISRGIFGGFLLKKMGDLTTGWGMIPHKSPMKNPKNGGDWQKSRGMGAPPNPPSPGGEMSNLLLEIVDLKSIRTGPGLVPNSLHYHHIPDILKRGIAPALTPQTPPHLLGYPS